MGTIHGGAIATWVDVVTSAAILMLDAKERIASVSVNLDVDYMTAAPKGSDVYFRTRVSKIGKSLAFTSCDVCNTGGTVLAKSTHIKAFVVAKM